MAVNKVVFGDQTIMDISDSTVNANNLLSGVKAYGANGEAVTGAVVIEDIQKYIDDNYLGFDFCTDLKNGVYDATTGAYSNNTARCCSNDYIEIDPNKQYIFKTPPDKRVAIIQYDENKTIIDAYLFSQGWGTYIEDFVYNPAANAKYICLDVKFADDRNCSPSDFTDCRFYTIPSNLELDDNKISKNAGKKTFTETSSSFKTVNGGPVDSFKVDLGIVQDLHGYSKPWNGGAGKNKLPLTLANVKTLNASGTWSGNTYTLNGVTFTVLTDSDDNVIGITTNGTSSAETFFILAYDFSFLTVGTSYSMNGVPSGGSTTTYGCAYYVPDTSGGLQWDTGSGVTFTAVDPSQTTGEVIRIVIRNGIDVSGKTWYPMIRFATETDSTFEPYTNICSFTPHMVIDSRICNKNLLNQYGTDTSNGYIYKSYINSNGGISSAVGNWHVLEYVKVKPNTTYVLTGNVTGNTGNGYAEYDINKQMVAHGLPLTDPFIFTTTANTEYVRFNRYSNENFTMQLEEGSVPTPYEPYICKRYTINLNGNRYSGVVDLVTGIGIFDYRYKHVTKNTIVFTKSNNSSIPSGRCGYYSVNNQFSDAKFSGGDSNPNNVKFYFDCSEQGISATDACLYSSFIIGVGIVQSTQSMIWVNVDGSLDTVEKFQDYLETNPIDVVYELATPITVQLTPQQITAFALENGIDTPIAGQTINSIIYKELFNFDGVEDRIKNSLKTIEDDGYLNVSEVSLLDLCHDIYVYNSGNPTVNSQFLGTQVKYPVQPGNKVKLKFECAYNNPWGALTFYNANGVYVSYLSDYTKNLVVTVPNNCYYVSFVIWKNDNLEPKEITDVRLFTNNIKTNVELNDTIDAKTGKWLESTQTLSTSSDTTYTFTDSDITASSMVEVWCEIDGFDYSSMTVVAGSVTVVYPKYTSAVSMKCRINIKNITI